MEKLQAKLDEARGALQKAQQAGGPYMAVALARYRIKAIQAEMDEIRQLEEDRTEVARW